MNQVKQQLDISQFFNEETNKLRKTFAEKEITFFEILPNEVFYEIFEYLDGCDMINTFSNLNSRFQKLLNSSALPLKITLCSESKLLRKDRCKRIVIPNKHRIISLIIRNDQENYLPSKLFSIKALFHRLESLVLYNTPADKLESILNRLYHLPCLFSLTINHKNLSKNFSDIYSIILGLPLLKYCRLLLNSDKELSLPLSSNLQNNSIQHLIFCDPRLLQELSVLLSHTPRLNRLVCKTLTCRASYINKGPFIALSNLTYISIGIGDMKFDNFEMFIKNISSQLQVLRITTTRDLADLDADRWERLITTYMPLLSIFDFQYKEPIDNGRKLRSCYTLTNRFKSPFWIQRQWFLEIKIDQYERLDGLIIYAIRPSKKGWYDFSDHIANDTFSSQNMIQHGSTSNTQGLISETIQHTLTLIDISFVSCIELFIDLINSFLSVAHTTRLAVNFEISTDILSQFIHRLPNLISLSVWGLLSSKTKFVSINEENIENKILKVRLENMSTLQQIESIMHMCSCMEYLELGHINDTNIQALVQLILIKHEENINHHFTLCLKNDQADNEIIQELQRMIDTKIQHGNYTIKLAYGNIYLKCQL